MTVGTPGRAARTNFLPADIAFAEAFCADLATTAFTRTSMTRANQMFCEVTFRDMMHTECLATDFTTKGTFRTGLLTAK